LRRVLITGGGTGIGAATAHRLASAGHAVTICGRTRTTLEKTRADAQATHPIECVVLDVADEAGVAFVPREKAAAVLELCRKIDEADTRRKADIDRGVSVSALVQKKYK